MFNNFLSMIESYYNLKYESKIEIELLIKYLKEKNIDKSDFNNLFKNVVLKHSKKWKSLPDITIFYEILEKKKNLDNIALEQWKLVNKKIDFYSDVIFEDIRTQYAVEALGGWIQFCQRDLKYENLVQDRFIRYYKQCPENYEHKKLCGITKICDTIYIGDEQKCKQLINNNMPKEIENMVKKIVMKKVEETL